MTRWKWLAALSIVFVAATAAVSYADPQWPNVAVDEPQWPRLQPDDLPAQRPNPRPSFLDADAVTAYIMAAGSERALDGSKSGGRKLDHVTSDVTGSTARWPTLPPEKQPDPFAFEVGARYWYSSGSMNFAFFNGSPISGNPSSTLDWRGLSAHSGEVFARLDHKPSGFFVKGLFGLGTVNDGKIDDEDFFSGQLRFSSTTSDVKDGNLSYGMIDFGWAFAPTPGISVGGFVGYHYWHEKVTAYGIFCNQASIIVAGCPAAGVVGVGFDTAVLAYEPTWHAVRIGAEGKVAITDRWSVNGEIAVVPYAALQNKDSHLLRQSPNSLGPAPNIITDSSYAFGIETEIFVNYAVTPNIEIGGGLRYWGLSSRDGVVNFGPGFNNDFALNKFDQQRYGLLLQAKGKF